MPYSALFGGSSTTLASYTSDNGSTHSVVSTDGGTLRTDGTGNLEAVGNGLSCVLVSNYSPADQNEPLIVTFDVRDLGNTLIGAGIRVQSDGDGLFVRTNGFDNQIELVQYTAGRTGEAELDNIAVTVDQGTVVVRVELDGLNYEWFVGGDSQGTGTMHASLSTGTVGYEKYSEDLLGGERLISVETEAVGGGGTAPNFTVTPVISGDPYIGEVLTCDGGTVTGSPTPTKTYQWKVNAANISGETASTYTVDDADLNVGDDVTCTVTATNTGGSDNDTSNAIEILEIPTGSAPNCFVMTAGGLEPSVSRVMTAGGLFPPVA